MTKIIVGVDGSEQGAAALRWAVARSERTGAKVVALLAWSFFEQGFREPGEGFQSDFDTYAAERVLGEAIDAAGVTGEVARRTVNGLPAEALVKLANPDDVIVVGARGLGGFKGLLLGSVSMRVLELAPCPVVVIHDEEVATARQDLAVVVGIDGSERSMLALRWAAAEALSRGTSLRIVSAWQAPAYAEMGGPEVITAIEDGVEAMIGSAAGDLALDGITVERDVAYGNAARALLDQDEDASMIVVAGRGRGLLKRVLLGSTSRQVAQHATVPVVVVPGPE